MATAEQKAASRKVLEAVTALNEALENAGLKGLHVELSDVRHVGGRNARYVVDKIETRETVLP